jgi:hypothetical protein
MQRSALVGLLAIGLTAGSAVAQGKIDVPKLQKAEAPKTPAEIETIRKRGAEYLSQCMQDWEPATHMTKKDWERTCRRVVDERVKFMLGKGPNVSEISNKRQRR